MNSNVLMLEYWRLTLNGRGVDPGDSGAVHGGAVGEVNPELDKRILACLPCV
jgi:hypothetical protein